MGSSSTFLSSFSSSFPLPQRRSLCFGRFHRPHRSQCPRRSHCPYYPQRSDHPCRTNRRPPSSQSSSTSIRNSSCPLRRHSKVNKIGLSYLILQTSELVALQSHIPGKSDR